MHVINRSRSSKGNARGIELRHEVKEVSSGAEETDARVGRDLVDGEKIN